MLKIYLLKVQGVMKSSQTGSFLGDWNSLLNLNFICDLMPRN